MQSIWKYSLETTGDNVLDMPQWARVLDVQAQQGVACIWVLVPDINGKRVKRTFTMYATGQLAERIEGEYVGTFQLFDERVVFHVFERIAK